MEIEEMLRNVQESLPASQARDTPAREAPAGTDAASEKIAQAIETILRGPRLHSMTWLKENKLFARITSMSWKVSSWRQETTWEILPARWSSYPARRISTWWSP